MAYDNAFQAKMPNDVMYQASRKEASRKKPVFLFINILQDALRLILGCLY